MGELEEILAIVRKTVATRCENSGKEQRMLFGFHEEGLAAKEGNVAARTLRGGAMKKMVYLP